MMLKARFTFPIESVKIQANNPDEITESEYRERLGLKAKERDDKYSDIPEEIYRDYPITAKLCEMIIDEQSEDDQILEQLKAIGYYQD
jgi:hypothetical protein